MSSRYTAYTRLKIDHPGDRILQVVSLYGALIAQFSDVTLPIAPIRSETDNSRAATKTTVLQAFLHNTARCGAICC